MVNLVDCGRNEFIRRMQGKKLYCFGAGKDLQHFVNSGYGIPVEAVIDNYKHMDKTPLYLGENVVRVISVDTFETLVDENSAVMITCFAIEEILEQLDSIARFDGLECYVDAFIGEATETSVLPQIRMPEEAKIPKKIHYCWFGGKPLPQEYQKYMESWRKYCPDYEIIRWDEFNYDVHKNPYIHQAYEQKKWAFVTDYARVDILYREGGIYFDTDVEVTASFDEFLVWDLFCGFESPKWVAWGLGYGAVKGHPILKAVMEVYEAMPFVYADGSLNLKTCPVIQSQVLQSFGFEMNGEFQSRDGVALYPKDFFSPIGQFRCFGNVTENTHSIHHYAASWHDGNQKKVREDYVQRILRIKNHNLTLLQEENYAEQNETARIKKYQIWECLSETGTAGSKAPTDVHRIAGEAGYQVLRIHPFYGQEGGAAWKWTHRRLREEWAKCYETIPENSILLLQHPFWQEQEERKETLLRLKRDKHVSIISLVHDVEALRGAFLTEYMCEEFAFMLEIADVLIVHNARMREYFCQLGVEAQRIVCLNIFDYLIPAAEDASVAPGKFEKSICIAGNLDAVKSPYIGRLGELNPLKIHLYGPNFENAEAADKASEADKEVSDIIYHGAFGAEEIPGQLRGGFGLVWDGVGLECCSGSFGEYLRYNNPHKLSLYLAAGLPVFIWKEAALAEFVQEEGVGIAISSLHEIKGYLEHMKEEEYQRYLANVARISGRLRKGVYMREALEKAEKVTADKQ